MFSARVLLLDLQLCLNSQLKTKLDSQAATLTASAASSVRGFLHITQGMV
jgi:hypothetical protein